MYCNNCNSLIENEETVCPKCHFDNSTDLEETTEIFLNKVSQSVNPPKVEKKRNFITVFILLTLLIIGVIVYYVARDIKTFKEENTTTTTQRIVVLNQKFTFNGLKMQYSDENFGTSTNTIFYKNNNEYNVNISNISESDYETIVNSHELLDSKLGNIVTKTYAEEKSYSHLFTYKDEYYLITVNYLIEEDLESVKIQNEMSKIINSLEEK